MKKLIWTAFAALLMSTQAMASDDYSRLDNKLPNLAKGGQTDEIVEFFMYSCPHCGNLEKHVEDWVAANPDKALVKMPVQFQGGDNYVRAHFALEQMGVDSKDISQTLFYAGHLHARGKERFTNDEKLATFLAERLELNATDIENTMQGFAVKVKANKSLNLFKQTKHGGVPALVVNGQYLVQPSGSVPLYRMFEVADTIIADK